MFYTAAADLRKLIAALRDIELKETYITQLELVAAVCAYLTWPDVLADRLVHHFIDNKAARTGLIKGSSGKADSARIINTMHVELLALRAQSWFGFVYSEDKLSDLPSRNPLEATSASSRHLAPRGGLASCHALTSGQSRAPRAPGSPGPPDPTDR